MSNFWSNNPTRNSGALTTHDPTIAQGGVTYYGILKRWMGSAWVKEPLKVYLAGSWQSKPLKRWNGSAWVLIDTTGV